MNRTEAREKATALVAQMTIEEAASQLLHSSPAIPRLGIPAYDWWSEALHGVAVGGDQQNDRIIVIRRLVIPQSQIPNDTL